MLEVNLTDRSVGSSKVDDGVLRQYIGGSGLAAKLFFDRVSPQVDPLSPDNVLFVTVGPLSGTTMPGGARFAVCSKSPLTDMWGESSCGGTFAAWLRSAGYDGIAITGASDKPVYLVIQDGKAEIRDAADLWGKNTHEIIDLLKERHGGDKKAKVMTIGQAGENLVRFAAIANEKRDFAARCGMGTVMGAKKLKGIVAIGTGKVNAAVPEEFARKRKEYTERAKGDPTVEALKAMGTNVAMDYMSMLGDVPTKNWTVGDMTAFVPKIGGSVLSGEQYLKGTSQCHGCLVGCKRVVKPQEGPYQLLAEAGPEYEGVASLGSLLMIDDLAAIIKMNEMCNDYGLDVISCGCTIAMAMDCYEQGIISSKDADGIELKWGDAASVMKMIDKIATRDGFGDVLAEGAKRGAERIGKNASDYAVVIKGMEVPMHDPRALHGLGLSYATGVRGACHTNDMTIAVEEGFFSWPEVGLVGPVDNKSSVGKAEVVVICQNLGMIFSSAPMCFLLANVVKPQELVDLISAASGFDYTIEELVTAGERIWMLKRGLDNLMGVTAADDRLPKQILTAQTEGGAAGSVPDLELMLKEYYPLRGLDSNGRPTKEKLASLGLPDLAAKLA
jgi:aldehyde:ferredoxin oxidoreductase